MTKEQKESVQRAMRVFPYAFGHISKIQQAKRWIKKETARAATPSELKTLSLLFPEGVNGFFWKTNSENTLSFGGKKYIGVWKTSAVKMALSIIEKRNIKVSWSADRNGNKEIVIMT